MNQDTKLNWLGQLIRNQKTFSGLNAKTSLEDGLKKMWDWAKTQKQRPTKNMKYEVKKGIYEYWK